jgi:uncharacterized protein YqiB (DUF1249 family)
MTVPFLGTSLFVPNIGTMFKSLYSDEYLKLRNWLKDQRQSKELSMRDLGEILEVPHSFIGKIENGERRLDVIEYLQYCEALKIKPSDGLKAINPKY